MRAFLDAFSNMDPRFLGGNLKSDAPLPDTLLLATLDTPQGYFDCILSTEWADPVGFPPRKQGPTWRVWRDHEVRIPNTQRGSRDS